MLRSAAKTNQSGWTLIELSVVLAIIVALLSISLPYMGKQTQPAYRQLMQAEMLKIAQSLEENYRAKLSYQSVEHSPFPKDNPRYRMLLDISNRGQNFTLQAIPLTNQKEDGVLYLDASGARRLYPEGLGGSYVSW